MARQNPKKVLLLSSIGGLLEFYDFVVYAVFASYISSAFFPKDNAVSGLLETFAIFSVGYLVRPIGGIIFGHFGDRYGRKRTFTFSILMMAFATLLMAFVPTYASIGIAAPIVLTILRICQGLSIGGEIPGAITYVSEIWPRRRTLACGIIFCALVLGITVGTFVHILLQHTMTAAALQTWGWRIAFGLGGFFGLFGYLLRRRLYESPVYQAAHGKAVRIPAWQIIRQHKYPILCGWLLNGMISGTVVALFLMMPSYLIKLLHYPTNPVFWMNSIGLLCVSLACILFGWLGDIWSKRGILFIALVLTFILIPITYHRFIHHQILGWEYIVVSVLTMGMATGCVPSILADLFPTELRYSGVAIVYNLSFATTGGLAPLIIMSIIAKTHNMMAPAYYILTVCGLAVIGWIMLMMSKHLKHNID